jgi:hypothetical protein
MRLFEFDEDNVTVVKIVALTNQLKNDLENGEIGDDYTVDELLDYFQDYDVILDVNDLYNMIKTPPLKGVIKNIQGVTGFVGANKQKKPVPILAEEAKFMFQSLVRYYLNFQFLPVLSFLTWKFKLIVNSSSINKMSPLTSVIAYLYYCSLKMRSETNNG